LPNVSDPIAGFLKATGDPWTHFAFAIIYGMIKPSDEY